MDLGAYMQIHNLSELAKRSGIQVDRVRGYRLMATEAPVSADEIAAIIEREKQGACWEILNGVGQSFTLNTIFGVWSHIRQRREKKYIITDKDGQFVGFRWDIFHGKRRKNLKYLIKQNVRRAKVQVELWNKFAGRDDVLYIHAKLGSTNWSGTYWWDYKCEPWFLGACDDGDTAYCDIYAKIWPVQKGKA